VGRDFVAGDSPDVIRRLTIASTGTAVHRLMELLKYPPSRALLGRLIKKWFPEQEDRILRAVEFVQSSTRPPLSEIIQNGEVEWGFAFVENGVLIEGQVDLWGRSDSGELWIIDYKTGSPENKDKAIDQMSLYALALRKGGIAKPDEKISLAAVFPFAEQIFVEPEPPRARLNVLFGL
jgi:RecB family exonuclease